MANDQVAFSKKSAVFLTPITWLEEEKEEAKEEAKAEEMESKE
mgnify:CR=1 FL=1